MPPRLAATVAPVAATVDPIATESRLIEIAGDRSEDAQIRSAAEVSRRQIMADFKVIEPSYDAEVNSREVIRGITPFRGLRHYVVVTSPQGDEFVTGEARLSGTSWEGLARFGQASVGGGEAFHVRVIATNSVLSEGPFLQPADAMSSDSIVVVRRP